MLKRAMMAGLNAGGRQRRSTSRSRRCRSPGSSSRQPTRAGGHHDPARRTATRSRCVIRFFDARRHRHHRGRPAQDRAAVQPRGLPPGARRPRSATSASRPGPSSTTPPRSRRPSTSSAIRARRLQGRRRLRLRLDVVRHAERAGQARRRRARRQPVRLDRRASSASTATATPRDVADLVRASGAHLGAVHRPRRRAPHAHRRRGPRAHRRPRRCWRSLDAACRPPARRPRSPCRSPSAGRPSAIAGAPRRRGRVHQAVHAARSWTRPPSRASASPPATTAASSSPASCPPSTPPPRSSSCSSCWPHERPRCRRSSTTLPRVAHRPRDRRHAVGAEGHWSCARWSSMSKDREVELVDGVKVHPRRRVGAGPARPRGAGHPRLGRGRRPTPRPAAWPRSTPGASASCCAERRARANPRPSVEGWRWIAFAAMNVPDDLRYSTDHEWVRLEDGTRPDRHHRLRPGRARRRRVREVPEVGATVDGRRRGSARSSPPSRCPTSTRRSPARSSRSTPSSPTRPSGSTRTRTARAGSA